MRKSLAIVIIILILFAFWPSEAMHPPQRILFVGDSFTQGLYASSADRGYAFIVGRELDSRISTAHTTGVNRVIERYEQYKLFNPDLVVIEVGLNDVRRYEVAEWAAMYAAMLDHITADDVQVITLTMPNAVNSNDGRYDKYLQFNEAIRAESVARGITVADIWALGHVKKHRSQAGDVSAFAPSFTGDNFHFNDTGHQAIAAVVLQAIEHRFYLPIIEQGAYP